MFCPFCGERVAQQDSGLEKPLYQADVKRALRPAGKLFVYRDRTEFVTSSVQKAVFNYAGMVAVKKGILDSIDFITEDGHTETCPADRKCVLRAAGLDKAWLAPPGRYFRPHQAAESENDGSPVSRTGGGGDVGRLGHGGIPAEPGETAPLHSG